MYKIGTFTYQFKQDMKTAYDMEYRPLMHGKVVKDLGAKVMVSFTVPAKYVEDQSSVTLPIKKENMRVNEYGVVMVPNWVYKAIMDRVDYTTTWR